MVIITTCSSTDKCILDSGQSSAIFNGLMEASHQTKVSD